MITRRNILLSSAAGAAVTLLGAATGFAATGVEPGKKAKSLSGSQIKSLLDGNSIDGATHKGQLFTIEFHPNGTATKFVDDGRKAKGTWGVKDNSLWYKIDGISKGEKISLKMWQDPKSPFYKAISDSGKWVAFTVRKTA